MPATDRDPFILDRPTAGSLRARDALICVWVATLLLLVMLGPSVRSSGEKMEDGIERTLVLAIGKPAGWIADQLPVADAVDEVTAFLSPDDELDGPGGFAAVPTTNGTTGTGEPAPAAITADAFDAVKLGEKPAQVARLKKLLVTGDSLVQPLDVQLARTLSPDGVRTVRDAKLGTGISKTDLVDWGLLSTKQVKDEQPDAVVMFIGANEGFPFETADGKVVQCCSAEWAAIYATRTRQMMQTFRRDRAARVYWLNLPMPRDPRRQKIARVVNEAIDVAAQPFRAQVRVLDMNALFTPGFKYRASMDVDGRDTLVRESDGIHLNDAGARLAAAAVLERLTQDFKDRG